MKEKRTRRAGKLVPIVFAHVCCSGDSIFGQDANGDGYFRRADWGPDKGWAHVPPPLGMATRRRRRKP